MKKYLTLFFTMFKIGLFTFGGGYAMLALLESEFVDRKKWLTSDEFADMVALSESTPGPIAINSATYIGYRAGKVLGSTLATIAVCLPSLIIIYLISLVFDRFLELAWVAAAFKGIRACVVFLILSAGLRMVKKLPRTPLAIVLFVLTVACMVTLSLLAVSFSAVFYILAGAAVGLLVYAAARVAKSGHGGEK